MQQSIKLDKEILHIAKAVRRKTTTLATKLCYGYNSETLNCMCAVASYELFSQLKKFGYKPNFIVGKYLPEAYYGTESNHCWVELDKAIIDLTLTQFKKKAKKVSVLPASHPNFEAVKKNKRAISYLRKNWPHDQLPLDLLDERTRTKLGVL